MDKEKLFYFVVFLLIGFYTLKLSMDYVAITLINVKVLNNAFTFVNKIEALLLATAFSGISTSSLLKFGATRDHDLIAWNDILKMSFVVIISLFVSICYLFAMTIILSITIQNQYF